MGAIPRHSEHDGFTFFFAKPKWNQAPGLVHGFSHLTFQKCSERRSLLTFWSARYRLSILPTWSSKSAPSFWNANRALTTVLCALCRQLSHIQPATPETDALLRRPQEPHCPKEPAVSHPRVLSIVNSRYFMAWLTWWCGWHDDVADMMMGWRHDDRVDMMAWLTWWCGCRKLPTYGWWSWWMLT